MEHIVQRIGGGGLKLKIPFSVSVLVVALIVVGPTAAKDGADSPIDPAAVADETPDTLWPTNPEVTAEEADPPRFELHLHELPATDLGPTVAETLVRRATIRRALLKPPALRLRDLVPPGWSREREMRLARWNSPMGRLEYEHQRQLRAIGRNGLVGGERDIPLMLPLFTARIGGQPVKIGIPLLGR